MIKTVAKKYDTLPKQVKASVWFLFCSVLQNGITFLTTPIFTRLMSATDYGQYNVFTSWLSIITVFVTMQIYYGIYTQGLIKYDKDRDEYTSSLQGFVLTSVLVWLVIYIFTRNIWNGLFSLTTPQMLLMFSIIWSTAVFSFWAAEQRVALNYKKLVLVTLIVSVAKPTLGVILVYNLPDKVTAQIISLAVVDLLGYTWMFADHMKKGKKFYSSRFWKHALILGLPLIPHYLSNTVLNSADRIMIANYVSSEKAGIYSLAYSISHIMTIVNTAITNSVNPWIYQKIKDGDTDSLGKVAYPTMALVAAANIFLIAVAPEVVSLFAPAEYYEAIWVIPPVAMAVYFHFIYSFFANFEFYFEKTKYIAFATMCAAVANIILNHYFIQQYGYIAAGYTTLFCFILYAIGHYAFMRRICNKYMRGVRVYSVKIIMTMSCLFLGLGFALMATYNYPLLRYGFIAVMLIGVFIKRKAVKALITQIMASKMKKK